DFARRALAALQRAMGGGEEIRRGRFAGEEQPLVDGSRENGAVAGVAGQRVRIGAAGERIMRPARLRQWLQPRAKTIAEQACNLVDALRGEGADAGILQLLGKTSAEIAFDAGLAEWAQMERTHSGTHG